MDENFVTKDLNKLMACFVELSANKERKTLEQSVVKSLYQLLQCEVSLIRLYNGHGEYAPVLAISGNNAGINYDEEALAIVDSQLAITVDAFVSSIHDNSPENIYQQGPLIFWPLIAGSECIDIVIIDPRNTESFECDLLLLKSISCIFTNFIALVDAGERDALTGLYNRRIFDTRLCSLVRSSVTVATNSLERRKIEHEPYNYLGIIDIDYFKRVNDDYGHLFGDEVLLWLAQNMRQCFRNEDALFRYGGEEFAVLLTGLSQAEALEAFERFRKTIAETQFPQIGQITVSIGYSNIDSQANPTLVFGDADKALYYAKEHGRNRVECYQKLVADNLLEQDVQDNQDIELFD